MRQTESDFGRDARRERLRRFRPGFRLPFLPAEDADETGWDRFGWWEHEYDTDQRGRRYYTGRHRAIGDRRVIFGDPLLPN